MVYVPLSPRRREAFRRLRNDPQPTRAPAPMLRPITLDGLAPAEELRDCVRTYPTSGNESILLVVYDAEGILRVEMRVPRAWVTVALEKWLLKLVRYYSRYRLRRLK